MRKILQSFLSFVLLACTTQAYAQVDITTPDTTICPSTSVTLNAVTNGRIPNNITLTDDFFTSVIPLGFSFNYFNNTYTDCIISSNGYIKFGNNGQAGGGSNWQIGTNANNGAIPGNVDVYNSIMAFYADTDPGVSGTLDYATMGTAPFRKFVVSFCDVAMFSGTCNSLRASFQIILYETTNNIEIHIANAPNCPSWNSGYAIEGIQNIDGTIAYDVPGRNFPTQWTAFQSSHRFEPTGPNSYQLSAIPYNVIPNANATISWFTNGVTPAGTGPSITVSPGIETFYVAMATNCQDTVTDTVTVYIDTSVVADFSFNIDYGCSGDTVNFVNLSSNAYFNTWDFADGTGDTATNPSHIYLNQNTYNVKLVATRGGCKDSVTKLVDTQHPLNAAFTVDEDSVCQGAPVTFSNASNFTTIGGPPKFWWDFGDGGVDSVSAPVHTYTNTGVYTAMLVVTDFVPCTDTAWQTIVVDSMPSISFAISDSSLCEGQGITFVADYSPNGNEGIIWDFGDGNIVPDQDQILHAYDSAGQFTVTLFGLYRICPDISTNRQIEIRPFPSINLGPDTSLCSGSEALLIRDLTNFNNPAATWMWNTGDSGVSSVVARHEGVYAARVTLNGCSASDSVNVAKDCYLDIPNSFTPNGDGNNDYFLPRQLLSQGLVQFKMTIYNRWGQEIFATQKPDGRGWDGRFNDKDQPEGVYIYLIEAMIKNGRTEKYQGNVTLLR